MCLYASWVEKNMRAGMITLHELLCSVEGHVGRLDIVVYCWWRRQQWLAGPENMLDCKRVNNC